MIDPAWVSVLSAILFIIGVWGAFTRKNAIIVLMCLELILNAANLQFVAAAIQHGDAKDGFTQYLPLPSQPQKLRLDLQFSLPCMVSTKRYH